MRHAIADETFAKRRNQWNPAADAAFKQKIHARAIRCRENFEAVFCDQLLVRRDHGFAGGDRAQDVIPRRVHTADQLCDDLNFGIVQHGLDVAAHERGIDRNRPRFAGSFCRDPGDAQFAAGALRDQICVALQDCDRAATNGAEAQNSDVDPHKKTRRREFSRHPLQPALPRRARWKDNAHPSSMRSSR